MRTKFRDIPAGTRFRVLRGSEWWDAGWEGTKLYNNYVRFHHPSKNVNMPRGLANRYTCFGACADDECVWAVPEYDECEIVTLDFTNYDEGGVV